MITQKQNQIKLIVTFVTILYSLIVIKLHTINKCIVQNSKSQFACGNIKIKRKFFFVQIACSLLISLKNQLNIYRLCILVRGIYVYRHIITLYVSWNPNEVREQPRNNNRIDLCYTNKKVANASLTCILLMFL